MVEPADTTAGTQLLQDAAIALSNKQDAAVLFYSGTIEGGGADQLRKLVSKVKMRKHKKCYFILTTNGGDPSAGYRIARTLQKNFSEIIMFVVGFCKSAGTLVALGADELIMGDTGELGPLDIQTTKRDDLTTNSSGLDIFKAIAVIQQTAFGAFEEYFLNIIGHSGGAISAKTAADIAGNLVTGIFGPMMDKIEPLGIGEMQRAINIATAYGNRLGLRNIEPDALDKLVTEYPTHGFVIDKQEAESIFKNVRFPVDEECAIENLLNDFFPLVAYHQSKELLVCDLTTLVPSRKEEDHDPSGDLPASQDGHQGDPICEADRAIDETLDADSTPAGTHHIDGQLKEL